MPGLYDSYQLSNSRDIPQYAGAPIQELQQTGNVLQNRYDTGVQQADILDRSINNSSAASVDQPLLNQLKGQYRDKLKDYADKGNYEDMWRNVAMDANDFHDKYATIAGNAKAISDWSSDLDKRVSEGKLDSDTARLRKAQMQDTYTGLKVDPETDQFTNGFQGTATTPSVDVPKKINEWLEHSNAVKQGYKAERDVNGWYITNGTHTERLPWEKIKPVIDAGIATDPEVKSWLQQEGELAPYRYGLHNKMSIDQVQHIADTSPTFGPRIQQAIVDGVDPVQAVHGVVSDAHVNGLINNMYNFAKKGVINNSESEYGEKMDALTEAKKKKELEQPGMFSVPFSDVTPGTKIDSIGDFKAERGKASDAVDAAKDQLIAFEHAGGVTNEGDKWYKKEVDGTRTDITQDHDALSLQIDNAQHKVGQMDAIDAAAARDAGYNPGQATAKQRAAAQQEADAYKKDALKSASQVIQNSRNGPVVTGTRQPTQDEIDTINKHANDILNQHLIENDPTYSDYLKGIQNRLKPQGEGNKMWVFNDNDPAKKTLEAVADASISKLGLKDGLVSLKYASGAGKMGQDLSADDYDNIKGKMNVVGVANDAKTGDTKIILRANPEVKGKKVSGENMVLSMKDVGGLDQHLQKILRPEDYQSLTMDRTIKSGLNNVGNSMNYPIAGSDGTTHGVVQITRKRGMNEGPGAFSMRVQTPSGWRAQSFDSYEGMIDKIKEIQSQFR